MFLASTLLEAQASYSMMLGSPPWQCRGDQHFTLQEGSNCVMGARAERAVNTTVGDVAVALEWYAADI
jgi:hypothetical protein